MADAKIALTAEDRTKAAFASVQGSLQGLQTKAVAVTGALGGIGVGVLAGAIKAAINDWDELGKAAQRAGFDSAQSMGEFRYAADLAGVDANALETAVGKLAGKMADAAAGNKEAAATFAALGIKIKESNGELRNSEAVITDLARAFAGYRDGPEKTALALDLFGKSGKQLIPLLNGGAKGLEALRAEFRQLHGQLTGDMTRASEQVNDNIVRLSTSASGLSRELAERMLPGLVQITDEMVRGAKEGGALLAMWRGLKEFGTIAVGGDDLGQAMSQAAAMDAEMTRIRGIMDSLEAVMARDPENAAAKRRFDNLRKQLEGVQKDATKASEALKQALDPIGYNNDPSYWAKDALRFGAPSAAPILPRLPAGVESEYAKINKELEKRLALEREEAAIGGKLSEARKFEVELLAKITGETKKLSAAEATKLKARVSEIAAVIQGNTLWAENAAIIAKNTEAVSRALDVRTNALESEIQTNDRLRDEIALIGLDETARTRRLQVMEEEAIARLELDRIGLQNIEGTEAQVALIEREIRLRRTRLVLLGQRGEAELEDKHRQESLDRFKAGWESIDSTAHDVWTNIWEGGSNVFKKLGQTLKASLLDLLYQMTVKKWIFEIYANVMGGGSGNLAASVLGGGGGGGGGALGMASNGLSLYNAGASAYTVGSQVFGGTMSAANAMGTVYANATNTGLSGLLATNGAYGTAAGSTTAGAVGSTTAGSTAGGTGAAGGAMGAASAVLVFLYALVKVAQDLRGEQRGGAQFTYDTATGTSAFVSGPDGSRAEGADELQRQLTDATFNGLNAAFRSFGSDVRVTGLTGAYESSARSRGGVFSGGTLSTGARFGEDGSGSNYDWTGPLDSKYEMWGMTERGPSGLGGSADMSGDLAELATDMQQSFIAALQASVGIIPRIVETIYPGEVTVSDSSAEGGNVATDSTVTTWARVFDEEMKVSARELGLLPQRILDLIIDIDPEMLSAEASAELSTKISTMVAGVQGFRALVQELPFDYLREKTFDWAAGLVEAAGSLANLDKLMRGYYANYYTQEEQRVNTAKEIQARLIEDGQYYDLDAILNTTRENIRRGVEEYAAMGEEGQAHMVALLEVSTMWASIIPATEANTEAAAGAIETVSEAMRGLQTDSANLEVALMRAQGNGTGADAAQYVIDTAGMTAAERAVYDYNASLRAQIEVLDAATARAAQVAGEREQLEQRLLELQGNTAELHRRALAAIDPSNRALQELIWELEAAGGVIDDVGSTISDTMRRLQDETASLEAQLLRAQGDPAGADAAQYVIDTAGMTAAERAVYDYNQSIRAQIDALTAAAAAERQLADQRAGMERQLLQAQGNTAALRELDLAELPESLHALQQEIWAVQDAAQASQEAAQANNEIMQEVDRTRSVLISSYQREASELESTISRLKDFATGIRSFRDSLLLSGELSPLTPEEKYREALKQFQSTSAAARRGDVGAMGRMEEVSRTLLDTSREFNATNDQYLRDFAMVQAALTTAAASASSQASMQQRQLDAVNSQLSMLGQIDDKAASIAEQLASYQEAILAAITAGLDPQTGSALAGTGVAVDAAGSAAASAAAIPAFATGGWHEGGLAVAGEYGRELIYTPPSRIFNAQDTNMILGGGRGGGRDDGALLAAFHSLLQEVKTLRATVAAGDRMNAEATLANAGAVSSAVTKSASVSAHRERVRQGAAVV